MRHQPRPRALCIQQAHDDFAIVGNLLMLLVGLALAIFVGVTVASFLLDTFQSVNAALDTATRVPGIVRR